MTHGQTVGKSVAKVVTYRSAKGIGVVGGTPAQGILQLEHISAAYV